ncbi:MAG: response regulator [Candidatus Omnitrophica bacterium]|nr:response regulator [Candidatus Omnitrophota bacterium]
MGKKILIVDDDRDLTEAVAGLLEAEGYEAIIENEGQKGVARARQEKPDLMLLDVMMPGADGFDIAREMTKDEITNKIPVIMLTGVRKAMGLAYKFSPDEVWLPVKAVLEKPINPELLLKTVKNYV